MEIPQEILDNRVLIVKPDTDLELILSVEHYNSRMAFSRKQMKSMIRLERIALLLNVTILIAIGVIGIRTGGVFVFEPRIEWLEYTVLGLYVAAFFWFGLIKRNFIVLTLFSALLIFMDVRCVIMAVLNGVLSVLHVIKQRDVKARQGYPFFRSIHIERGNGKASAVPEQSSEQAINEILKIPLDKSGEK